MMRRLLVMQDPDDLARQLRFNREPPVSGTGGGVIRFQPAGQMSNPGVPVLEKVDEARRRAETEAILRALNASHWNRNKRPKY